VCTVNAANAGSGNLEISITCRGETIPNNAQTEGPTGAVQVSFTPKYVDPHHVQVLFNGELIPGIIYCCLHFISFQSQNYQCSIILNAFQSWLGLAFILIQT
jgi:hypothetical protein